MRAGEEVLQIVPTDVPQVLKAAVASEDQSKLKIGQKVQMRVSVCPYPDYGTLNGEVQTISPDAFGKAVPQAFAPQKNSTNASMNGTTSPKATVIHLYLYYG